MGERRQAVGERRQAAGERQQALGRQLGGGIAGPGIASPCAAGVARPGRPSAHRGGAVGHFEREGHGCGHCAVGGPSAPLVGRAGGAGGVRAPWRVDWGLFRWLTVLSARSSDRGCRDRGLGAAGNGTATLWRHRGPQSQLAGIRASGAGSPALIARPRGHRHPAAPPASPAVCGKLPFAAPRGSAPPGWVCGGPRVSWVHAERPGGRTRLRFRPAHPNDCCRAAASRPGRPWRRWRPQVRVCRPLVPGRGPEDVQERGCQRAAATAALPPPPARRRLGSGGRARAVDRGRGPGRRQAGRTPAGAQHHQLGGGAGGHQCGGAQHGGEHHRGHGGRHPQEARWVHAAVQGPGHWLQAAAVVDSGDATCIGSTGHWGARSMLGGTSLMLPAHHQSHECSVGALAPQ